LRHCASKARSSNPSQADVRDLDIQDWDCPPEGDAQSDADQDRNERKNRERLSSSAANAITELDCRWIILMVKNETVA